MEPARNPTGLVLGVFALFGLAVGVIGGPCGDTLAEQALSVTAVPAALAGFGFVADRAAAADRRHEGVVSARR